MKKSDEKTKKVEKNAKKAEKTKKKSGFLWFLGVSAMSVALLLGCQFFFENTITGKERFYENTSINGLDVSGMSVAEAENVVLTDMLNGRKDIEIELYSKDKSWTLSGNDFEVSNKLEPQIIQLSKFGKDGNFFQNLIQEKKIKSEGKNFEISYTSVLADIDEKIDEIISQVEQEAEPASLVFTPDKEEAFEIDYG